MLIILVPLPPPSEVSLIHVLGCPLSGGRRVGVSYRGNDTPICLPHRQQLARSSSASVLRNNLDIMRR